jgi:hypothetical protein
LTRDLISLLRVVVTATHVLSGLGLFAAIRREWRDPAAGIAALLMLALVPHWYVVVGNANLTAAFGQSMATIALCVAVGVGGPRAAVWTAALFATASVAFLSHVGTFPTLAVSLLLLAGLSRLSPSTEHRRGGTRIAVAAVAAAILAVVLYYGRFGEVYQSLDRVMGRGPAATSPAAAAAPPSTVPMPPGRFPRGGPTPSTVMRAATAADVGREAVGWPILILAVAGAGYLFRTRAGDRLTRAVAASLMSGLLFAGFGILVAVEDRFYRYNVEFIGRVMFATWPAVVALAGLGAAVAWRSGPLARAAAVVLAAAVMWLGASAWWSWIH